MAQNAWQASVYADGLSIQVTNISVSAKKNIGIQSSIFKPRNMSETWINMNKPQRAGNFNRR